MRNLNSIAAILIIVGVAQADEVDQSWQIHGQVVDEQGAPVEDFEAATFWLANGNWWNERGELLEEAAEGKLWTNEGVLAPSPHGIAQRLPGGIFTITIEGEPRIAVFAVDQRNKRGGIVLVEQSVADKPVTIMMAPLVRVTAKVFCSEAGKTPDFANAAVYVPDGKGNRTKLTICGSFRGEISFLLPPGKYHFDVFSKSPSAMLRTRKGQTGEDVAVGPPARGMRVEVPRGKTTLDLGVLDLALPRDKDGIPRDLTQYYGKAPPELAITDARGVPKTVKLADFRGKWVLLEFWSLSCGPCVVRDLPERTKFYEEYVADRDRFEILAICNTEDKNARTIEAYDALAAPLVEQVWGGKQLPFPVLIDGEGKTFGAYGIQGYPNLLIDPEGRLVKDGDVATLAEKLKEKKP